MLLRMATSTGVHVAAACYYKEAHRQKAGTLQQSLSLPAWPATHHPTTQQASQPASMFKAGGSRQHWAGIQPLTFRILGEESTQFQHAGGHSQEDKGMFNDLWMERLVQTLHCR